MKLDLSIIFAAWAAIISIAFLLTSCGDWQAEQTERVQIVGEPVDEAAVLDAVATIMGESDMHSFAILFTTDELEAIHGDRQRGGGVSLCGRRETIEVHLDNPDQCLFNTDLVHELLHRYDHYVLGTPCGKLGHPPELFDGCNQHSAEMEINRILRQKHCPGVEAPVTCVRS